MRFPLNLQSTKTSVSYWDEPNPRVVKTWPSHSSCLKYNFSMGEDEMEMTETGSRDVQRSSADVKDE